MDCSMSDFDQLAPSSPTFRKKDKIYNDRFIPSRTASDFSRIHCQLLLEGNHKEESTYSMLLRSELLLDENRSPNPGSPVSFPSSRQVADHYRDYIEPLPLSPPSPSNTNVLRFKSPASPPVSSPFSLSPMSARSQQLLASVQKSRPGRKIPKVPMRILEAPGLQDDFYLNLLDWASTNVVAVGLASALYVWSAMTLQVTKIGELPNSAKICSVAWNHKGHQLAVGTSTGEIQLWDITRGEKLRNLEGHQSRIGSLAWNDESLTSGGRDRVILHMDTRSGETTAKMSAHKQEICGLKWSPENCLASGGNDNKLFVWDIRWPSQPQHRFQDHKAAVKALAWSPHHRGILASGGGTSDRCIKTWNTLQGAMINSFDTGSQVCNLAWSKTTNEVVSTHGYSQNQVVVWMMPQIKPIATLTGHTMRVLYLAMSPDGQTVVTGAADESLRFWNVFPSMKNYVSRSPSFDTSRIDIR